VRLTAPTYGVKKWEKRFETYQRQPQARWSENGSVPPARCGMACGGVWDCDESGVHSATYLSPRRFPDGDTSHSIPSPYASPNISFARESPPSDQKA
jgi:hypothetical protein